jgi:hypothetical protein
MPTFKQSLHGLGAGLLGAVTGALAPYTTASAVKACLASRTAALGCIADARTTAIAGAVAFVVMYVAQFPRKKWPKEDPQNPNQE